MTTESERAAILRNFFSANGRKGGLAGTGKAKVRDVDYSAIGKAGSLQRWAGHVKKGEIK